MSNADDRAFLRKRHAACLDKIADFKALPSRTAEQKDRLNTAIEATQCLEKLLEEFEG
jgi:hypothetical protein